MSLLMLRSFRAIPGGKGSSAVHNRVLDMCVWGSCGVSTLKSYRLGSTALVVRLLKTVGERSAAVEGVESKIPCKALWVRMYCANRIKRNVTYKVEASQSDWM